MVVIDYREPQLLKFLQPPMRDFLVHLTVFVVEIVEFAALSISEVVDIAPGEVSQPHRHNADLFVYVLEGSVVTQVKGGSSQTVHAGEVFYELPTDVHIVSRNASDTQPAKLLVFYVKAKGTPPTVLLEGRRKVIPLTKS